MNSYGKTIELIGSTGSGQLAKMINQICIAGLVQGLSEAMAFGKKANLDMEKVLQVILTSKQMRTLQLALRLC